MANKNRKSAYIGLIIVAVAAISVLGMCFTGYCAIGIVDENDRPGGTTTDTTDNVLSSEAKLAQCLTENGAVMYGAYWCGACKSQKAVFGDDFQYINYVECTEDQAACVAAGVDRYPTWNINGQNSPGVKDLGTLAELVGCTFE
jgi:hypothetical protein